MRTPGEAQAAETARQSCEGRAFGKAARWESPKAIVRWPTRIALAVGVISVVVVAVTWATANTGVLPSCALRHRRDTVLLTAVVVMGLDFGICGLLAAFQATGRGRLLVLFAGVGFGAVSLFTVFLDFALGLSGCN
jgi:hypothetical protein